MPSILLINDNKIVSRLLQLSSKKHNYDLEEISDYNPRSSAYNVIFVDSHKYNSSDLKNLIHGITYDKLGFIGSKNSDIPSEFEIAIEKPFLPTDFVSLIDENFKVVDSFDLEDQVSDEREEEELQLDELEELAPLDDTPLDEEVVKDLDKEDLLDELEIPEMTLSTGIANTFQEENDKIELADMVDEIDNMSEEESIEDLSLEDLKIDESLDHVDDKSKNSVEEIEDEIDASLASIIEEEEPQDSLDISEELIESAELKDEEIDQEEEPIAETIVEEKEDSSSVVDDVVSVASLAGLGAVAVDALDDNKEEEVDTMIDELDGIEDIEKESDYLADEFTDLDEKEIGQALGEELSENLDVPVIADTSDVKKESENFVEEIISEEVSSEGEEKVVEPTDLEEMIQKAVAASITPELLQKALEGMDINVSLSFSPKDEEVES